MSRQANDAAVTWRRADQWYRQWYGTQNYCLEPSSKARRQIGARILGLKIVRDIDWECYGSRALQIVPTVDCHNDRLWTVILSVTYVVRDIVCEGFRLWVLWVVRDIVCEGYRLCVLWVVRDIVCVGFRLWVSWVVRDIVCEGFRLCYGLWEIWFVWALGCECYGLWEIYLVRAFDCECYGLWEI